MSRSARFLYIPVGWDFDNKIIESISRLHHGGKWITVTAVAMDAGFSSSDVSRYFRDHGIFWDSWRREWVVAVPEIAAPITAKLPPGAFPVATWLRPRWLAEYRETVAQGAGR